MIIELISSYNMVIKSSILVSIIFIMLLVSINWWMFKMCIVMVLSKKMVKLGVVILKWNNLTVMDNMHTCRYYLVCFILCNLISYFILLSIVYTISNYIMITLKNSNFCSVINCFTFFWFLNYIRIVQSQTQKEG